MYADLSMYLQMSSSYQSILNRLVANISTLASVYHQLPETFLSREKDHHFTDSRTQAEPTMLSHP